VIGGKRVRSLEVNDQNQLLTVKTCTASRLYHAFYLRPSAVRFCPVFVSVRGPNSCSFVVLLRISVRLHLCSDSEQQRLNRKFFDQRCLHRSQYLLSGRAGKSDPKIGAGMSGN
jgi:hypothetical protein